MNYIESDWKELENDLTKFEKNHKAYVKKLEEVESLKKSYAGQFQHYKKKLHQLNNGIKKIDPNEEEDPTKLVNIKAKVVENLEYLNHISDTFPADNGFYLKLIIGGVNVSILNKEEKFRYKEEYEMFKLRITMISMVISFCLLFTSNIRELDAVFNFIQVWYYCTLTIRESILIVNGSKINGWWMSHHFITTVCTAIVLIWPDTESYHSFRNQFTWFSLYISMVQVLQYYYQKGCLYRLRALGEKQDMDVSVEGFQSWMTKGLSFLLPFLFFGYFWELYNAYILYIIYYSDFCNEWQVIVLSFIFFVLFLGNFFTTYMVIRKKLKNRLANLFDANRIRHKYSKWQKLRSPSEEISEKKDE